MVRRQGYPLVGVVILGCVMFGCSPPQPPTDVPITTASEEARQFFIQGRDNFENADLVKAAGLFDQAIQKDPKFALAYIFRSVAGGGATVAHDNRNKAMALLAEVSRGEQLVIRFLAAQSTQQGGLAKQCLDSLLIMFPNDKRILLEGGVYYRTLGDLKTAVTYYEKAVGVDSTYAPPYNLLGYDNATLGKPEAAEKAFKTYMQLLPTSPNPVDSYAEFLRLQGRYEESIAQYRKVLEMDSSFTSSISGIGDCNLCRGDTRQAREYYREYIGKTPQINAKLNGYFSIAASYVQDGNIPEALKALDERRELAIAQNQPNAVASSLAYQAYLLSALGDPKEGIKKYNDMVAFAKTATMPERTRENLLFWSNYWLAYAHTQAKDMKKGEEYLKEFSRMVERRGNPGEFDAVTSARGYIAIKEGKYDEAIDLLADLPDEPFTEYALTLAHMKKGDKDSAAKMIEKLRRWETVNIDNAVALRLATALMKK